MKSKINSDIAQELENLINTKVDTSYFPYVRGKSIRIGHIIVRETRFGFLVFDTKNKVKNEMKVGMKVNVVQKTKKTPGIITKIMNARCLVDLNGKVYRVPMSMLEAA